MTPGSSPVLSSTVQVRRWTARNSFVGDSDTICVAVTHRAATWARDDPERRSQRYAFTFRLEDQDLVQANLHELLTTQVRVLARIRIRS